MFEMPPLIKEQISNLVINSDTAGDCICKAKCVLVGDGAIGKTSLIVSYTTNGYPTEYVPTAFDNYSVVVNVNNQPIRLQLCDTAGQDDFDAIRPLCYPQTDIFLLCYSVVSPTSFYNLQEKWIKEIRDHCLKTPILLVGTQCDLRTNVQVLIDLANYDEHPVSEQEASAFSSRIGAIGHFECSALTQKNLKEVFDAAILAALKIRRPDLVSSDNSKGKSRSIIRKQKNSALNSAFSENEQKKRGWKRYCCFL